MVFMGAWSWSVDWKTLLKMDNLVFTSDSSKIVRSSGALDARSVEKLTGSYDQRSRGIASMHFELRWRWTSRKEVVSKSRWSEIFLKFTFSYQEKRSRRQRHGR